MLFSISGFLKKIGIFSRSKIKIYKLSNAFKTTMSCPALFLFLQLLSVLYMLNHSACYIGFKRREGLIETCLV